MIEEYSTIQPMRESSVSVSEIDKTTPSQHELISTTSTLETVTKESTSSAQITTTIEPVEVEITTQPEMPAVQVGIETSTTLSDISITETTSEKESITSTESPVERERTTMIPENATITETDAEITATQATTSVSTDKEPITSSTISLVEIDKTNEPNETFTSTTEWPTTISEEKITTVLPDKETELPAVKIGIETTTTIPSFTSTEKETEISTLLPEIPAVQVEFETTTTTKPSTESLATTLVSTDKEQPTISTLKPEKTKPTISEIGIDTTSAPEISKTTEIPSTTTLLPDISKIQTTTTTRPTTLETITGEPIVDYITTTRRPLTMVNESATVIYPPTSLEPIIEDHSTIVPYPPIDGDHTIIIELPSNKTDMAQIETTTAFMDHHPELSTVVTTDSSLIIEDHSTIKPISPTEFVPIEMNKTEPSEKGLIHLTSTLSPEDNETKIPIVGESALTTKLPDTSLMINVTTPQPELSKSTKSMITIEPDTSEPESATKPLIISSEEPEEEVWTDTPTVIVTVPTINENVTIISESKHEISTTKLPFYPVTTGTQQQQQQEEEEEQIEQEEEPDETIAPRPVTPKPGVKTKLKKPTQQQQRPDDGVKKPSYRPSSSSFTPFTDLGDGCKCHIIIKLFKNLI